MNVSSVLKKAVYTELLYKDSIFTSKCKMYSFLNPYAYHLLRKNIAYFENLDGLFFDGILLCIFYRVFYGFKVTRRSFDMTTIANELFSHICKTGETIYFIGAKDAEIDKSIFQYKKVYPKMNIIGYRNGYFTTNKERQDIIEYIVNLSPDFVIIGMGTIVQEEFIIQLKRSGFKGIGFTCGGFLHQTTNDIKYFPDWSNKFNLRGFYRLFKEKNIRKRSFNTFIQFPILFIIDYFSFLFSINKKYF